MGFGRLGNRYDSWLRFYGLHRDVLTGAGLPDVVTLSEDRLRDLLRDGSASGRGFAVSLAELSTEQWVALAQFVVVFFRECESFAPLDLFPAFRRETERRG